MNTNLNTPEKKQPKKDVKIGLLVVILLVAVWITKIIVHSVNYEDTDNAQIDGNIIPIRTTVSGFVQTIKVTENQAVKEGDTLIIFDVADLREQVLQAEACS